MSMTRTTALKTIAKGLRAFEGYTAGQVIESGWNGLNGLHAKDFEFFRKNANKPATDVASACHDRGAANPAPQVNELN